MSNNCKIGKIYNKNTKSDVCSQYKGKEIENVICNVGECLKVNYASGSGFTHYEIVLDVDETDYGFWVETTRKMWRFDYVYK